MSRYCGRIRHSVFFTILCLLLLRAVFASGEVSVSFVPASPRVGDCVDVTVSADGENIKGVRYFLSLDGKKVFRSRKPENHLTASFRPRKEGVYTLEVTVVRSGNRTETASVTVPVSGTAPMQRGETVIYSQKDGWWRRNLYSASHIHTLETSGCALFALSHALQRLGINSDEALPEQLAGSFGQYYSEGLGARTEALITQSGLHFGFQTVHRLVRAEDEIISFLQRGDLFCLGIVQRHVVLADGVDAENRKVHIVDSCPDTTFGRLGRTPAYILTEDGTWQTVRSAEEIPGVRWFFETSSSGGAGYWLDLDDCAARGLRLIRRPWLTLETENGETAVTADWFGTAESSVSVGKETRTVSTGSLRWFCDGADSPQLAVVTQDRGAVLTQRNGDKFDFKPVPWGTVLCALRTDEERVYVFWNRTFCYVKRSDVELISIPDRTYPSAVITAEGKRSGSPVRSYRAADESAAAAAEWPVGTEVVILARAEGFCFAEGLGHRGWIPEKNLTSGTDSR